MIDSQSSALPADQAAFWRIEFHYNTPEDGIQSMMLGQPPGLEPPEDFESHHIPINSLNGERIHGVNTMNESPRPPSAFTLHKTYGKSIRIPPEFSSINQERQLFTETLHPIERTIVEIFSILRPTLVFQNLRLAFIPS
ncbi:hypothetical protein B0J13DRAFT_557393 [Dactylonectria estremocensis]|uniref:Uncharacterized protein n=1 Tax=Dactylonectria estremocensis TaxID=1079267 RepID=A0A9P9J011_9HYPO|nr:hypothetical protein B0J13DRAFT_557393 [Dactylonectria estremocensis]